MKVETGVIAPISFVHQTKYGPVHLLVKAAKTGWVALYWGSRIAGTWPSATLAEANEAVLRCFRNMFFGHQCSDACGPVDGIAAHKSNNPWGMIHEI